MWGLDWPWVLVFFMLGVMFDRWLRARKKSQ